jgi:hypothetical protein
MTLPDTPRIRSSMRNLSCDRSRHRDLYPTVILAGVDSDRVTEPATDVQMILAPTRESRHTFFCMPRIVINQVERIIGC